MVIPFLGVYMTNHLKFSLEDTGMVLSCFGIGAVCGSFLGGWLTDKFGHFGVQLGSLILTIPMFIALPEISKVVSMGLGVFMLSIVSETFRPANSVSIAYYSRPENITRSFSLNRMAMNLGFSIGPALGGFLAAVSYSFLFYGNAIAAFLSAVVFFVYFHNKRSKAGKNEEEVLSEELFAAHTSPFRDLPFMLYSVCCCIFAVCFFQLLNTIPLYYRTVYKLTEFQIGIIMAYSGLVVFLLEMLLVHIAEKRLTTRQVMVSGTIICAVSFALMNLATGILVLYISITIISIAEILVMPYMATITLKRSSSKKRGAYMAVNALSFSAALIFSPLAGTKVAATFGFTNLWWVTTIILVFAAIGFWVILDKMKLQK